MKVLQFIGTLLLLSQLARAQYVTYPAAGTPRTRDGKANLNAPAPRSANGKPDLGGVWQAVEVTDDDVQALFGFRPAPGQVLNGFGEYRGAKYFYSILADFPEATSPLRPEFRQAYQQRSEAGGKDGPDPHCLPIGTPGMFTFPAPYKIAESGKLLLFLTEADGRFRQVYLDGRKLPVDPTPAWFGYSVGKWEGDTLVVQSEGFNESSWLDITGHVHSDQLKVTERFRRRDFGHMDVEITIDDPVIYSRAFTIKIAQRLLPDTDLFEYVCNENEKDLVHLNAPSAR